MENRGDIIRQSSGTSSRSTSPSKPIRELSSNLPTTVSTSPAKSTPPSKTSSSGSIPYIDNSQISQKEPSPDLPRYKVVIPSRFSPTKKPTPKKFEVPKLGSQNSSSSSVVSITSSPVKKSLPQTSLVTSKASPASSTATKAVNSQPANTKPVLQKFEQATKQSTVAVVVENSSSKVEVPSSVNIKSRIQNLEKMFAAQQPEAPPAPAPENLPLRFKKVLFEKKIREETNQKLEGIKRNQYLSRNKLSKPDLQSGLVKKMQEKLWTHDEDGKLQIKMGEDLDSTSNLKTSPSPNFKKAPSPVPTSPQKSVEFQLSHEDKGCSTDPEPTPSASTPVGASGSCFTSIADINDEESALAAFFDIDNMTCPEHETSVAQSDPYVARNRSSETNADTDAMSVCTQSSANSQASSPSKSSSSSNRMYPDLSNADGLVHDSPIKRFRINEEVEEIHDADDEDDGVEEPIDFHTAGSSKLSTPLRTISAYRLEQRKRLEESASKAVPKIVLGQRANNTVSNLRVQQELEYKEKLRRKIHTLKTVEIPKYEGLVRQCQDALETCLNTQFRDSVSHADAERHLLVSLLKRKAALNCVHELNSQLNAMPPADHILGTLSFKRIDVPIMRDTLIAHKKGLGQRNIDNTFFFIVISCNEIIQSTECLTMEQGLQSGFLSFKLPPGVVFSDLRSNFQMRLDIYALTLGQVIKKETKHSLRLTPKKPSKTLPSPSVEVREPSATLKGYIILNVKNLKKKEFELQNFRFDNALQGTIQLSLSLKPEYKKHSYGNFLSFYDDSVDVGCWKRRWCRVSGPKILYWRLPEDEEASRKPLGEIDLRHCINPEITAAPFDVCPRKESFVLLFAGTNADKTRLRVEWLVKKNYENIVEKNLMSADVIEERDEWISTLTDVLQGIRFWDEEALMPCSLPEMNLYISS